MPFGTLRVPNNPNHVSALIAILQNLATVDPATGLGNTLLAELSTSGTGLERVYVEGQKSSMLTSATFPALLIEPITPQKTSIGGHKVYNATMGVKLSYYDRWDRNSTTIEAIHLSSRQDLARIQANFESNPTLKYQGQDHSMSIQAFDITDLERELDEQVETAPLVKCSLVLQINSLPYDS
jgi:hypothetical protein